MIALTEQSRDISGTSPDSCSLYLPTSLHSPLPAPSARLSHTIILDQDLLKQIMLYLSILKLGLPCHAEQNEHLLLAIFNSWFEDLRKRSVRKWIVSFQQSLKPPHTFIFSLGFHYEAAITRNNIITERNLILLTRQGCRYLVLKWSISAWNHFFRLLRYL